MLDLIIFFILPVNVVLMLSVVLTPADPCFSLAYENKRANGCFFRNLHDDSPGDGVPVGEGVLAVDAVIFNGETRDSHIHQTEKGKSPAKLESSTCPVNADWLLHLFNVLPQESWSRSTCFSCLQQPMEFFFFSRGKTLRELYYNESERILLTLLQRQHF